MAEVHAQQLIHETRVILSSEPSSINFSIPFSLEPVDFRSQSLTLVLDRISDELLISITCNLSLLVKLELEDKPKLELLPQQDLTNRGHQFLGSCSHLIHLSLVRSREYFPATFSRVTNIGMFLLTEECESLESIKLGGFSKATDAGFASVLYSCKSLQKFEIINAFFLSGLAFHDLVDTPHALINVRLVSCSLIMSEAIENISSCKRLEVLDLWGCKSMADRGISSILGLSRLAALNLGGPDITNSGMSVLGRGDMPIVPLFLRGCKRITDRGLAYLLLGGGIISKTLAVFDIGYMPRISDRAIFTIAKAGKEITDLCIQYCFYVTDVSVERLASERGYGKRHRPLRRLDLCHYNGLSANSLRSLKKPSFRGLRWLGIGNTRLSNEGDDGLLEISNDRPGLSICSSGCEMGCYDGCISLKC